jgi:hypothetical protein
VCLAALPKPEPARVVITYDLAALTPLEAGRLRGTRARFRFTIDSSPDDYGGFTLYDAESPDDVSRSVWLVAGGASRGKC